MRNLFTKQLLSIFALLFVTNISADFGLKYPEGFSPKINTKISFTENKGQVHDQNYNPRPDILFSGTDGNLVFHLKNNGISYQLSRVDSWKKDQAVGHGMSAGKSELVPDQGTIYRLDINWLNTNIKSMIRKGGALEGFNNYYFQSCPQGALNVKSYEEITYLNIYEGVDLKWYQKDGHLKYDYIVAAGADYKQIQLEFKGAEKISLNSNGEIILKTPLGYIIEQAPLVFQNGKTLKTRWVIKNNFVCFDIENIDPQQSFIIDPAVRTWGTYYGGAALGYENGYACATDAGGNVYVAGYTDSNIGTAIATAGSHQTVYGGGSYDTFLVQFNSAGVRQWGTYYGGTGDDRAYSCATDATGNVYMAGYSGSNTGTVMATAGSHQPAYGGGPSDAFLVQFNSAGVRQWGTYYGGTGDDGGFACATDAGGNVYLSGITPSNTGTVIATAGSHQSAFGGIYDAFLVKFNSGGVRQWGTYYGGTGDDQGLSCVTDALGNVYMIGDTQSSIGNVIATPGSHQSAFGGIYDAFIVQFNSGGVRQWGTYYGGPGDDRGRGCASSASNVFLTGHSGSNIGTAIASAGSHQSANGGGIDAFLVQFNFAGVRQWGTYYGGTGSDFSGFSCTADAIGNVYLTGRTDSNTGTVIATGGSHQPANAGGANDAFLVQFNISGIRQWGTYYGGTGYDGGQACSIFGNNVYMAGQTDSNTGTAIATVGSHQSVYGGGGTDIFLAQFITCNTPAAPTNTTPIGNQTICANNSATLFAAGTGIISWFASPTGTASLGTGTTFITSTLSAGNYSYYAEDFTCVSSSSRTEITLTVTILPTISVNSGSICMGNSFTLIPSGANTYTFQGGSAIVSPTTNASYTVIGTNTAGCVSSSYAVSNVSVSASPTITVNSGSICSGNNFTMIPSGANTYTFQGGNAIVSPTITASYTVAGTNTAGCVSQSFATSNVTVNANPTISVNSGSICSGNNFTMIPSGANTYTFQGGNAIVSPTITASYTVAGTNTAGCVSQSFATSNVTVNTSPTISVNSGSICSGNNFTMIPSGANTYTFQGGNAIVSPTVNASYTVAGTSTAGCISQSFATSNVTVNANPTITVNSGSICSGNNFTMIPSGANTYTFQGGNAIVSPTINASYTVAGTNTAGCISQSFAVSDVTVFALPIITVNSGSICSGNSFTIVPSGANTYTFMGGGPIVTPSINTSYSVSGTSSVGCINSIVAVSNITVNALPTVSATSNLSLICVGESATLTASGANTYSWNTGGTNPGEVISPTLTTTYTVNGTDANGCSNTAIVTQSVDLCTGIQKAGVAQIKIQIYPNPNNGEFYISNAGNEVVELRLFNNLGQLIISGVVNVGVSQIMLCEVSRGLYHYIITCKENSYTGKIIVE